MSVNEMELASQKLARKAESNGWNREYLKYPKTDLKVEILMLVDKCMHKHLAITDREEEIIKEKAYNYFDEEKSILNF